VVDLLAQNPLLLLFTVIGIGYLIGNINIFGFKLGMAAVLFTGIFFGAIDRRRSHGRFLRPGERSSGSTRSVAAEADASSVG